MFLRSRVFLDLDHAERFQNKAELGAELDASDNLTPEQRQKKHDQKYEAEFVVELNMTKAHETGAKMGIVINRNADFEAATVFKVQKSGLIQDWNKANPGKDVHVGDELVRVNDIQWHANTETFMERIRGQFVAGRKQVDGASDILRLYIQRPRRWHHKRFALQREDLHNEMYAAEFVAELPLPDGISPTTTDGIMGWNLNTTVEWEPVTIQTIKQHGLLAKWNKLHNDSLILEGDEILKVDKVIWHHNSAKFVTNLQKHLRATQTTDATNKSVALSIRRPRPVQEAFDEAHPMQEVESCRRGKTTVSLRFPEKGEANLLGWKLTPGAKSETGVEGPVLVEKVRQEGTVAKWNERHLSRKIEAGDQIVSLNGVTWDKYGSATEFADAVGTLVSAATRAGPDGDVLRLGLERPVCTVKEHRLNMEHGVHMEKDTSEATTTAPAEDRSNTADEQEATTTASAEDRSDTADEQGAATTTASAEDRSTMADEQGAKGGGGEDVARPAALEETAREKEGTPKEDAQETGDGGAERPPVQPDGQSSGKALLSTGTGEADALGKAGARIAEIDALLTALGPLKEPKVVALVADLTKERAGLRTFVSSKDIARIAEIDATLKTLEALKEPKVAALVVDLKKERDGLRAKAGVEDDSADVTGAKNDAKADEP